VDANLLLRTHAAISWLHGDLTADPNSNPSAQDKADWSERVDSLSPRGPTSTRPGAQLGGAR